jgi:alcohol dehydrogenase class IV
VGVIHEPESRIMPAPSPDRIDSHHWGELVATLRDWTRRLAMPRLSAYGMGRDDVERVVANARGGSMKANPLVLSDAELGALLTSRL